MKRTPDFSRVQAFDERLGDDRLLKPAEVALMFGVSKNTLKYWRNRAHCGPDFIRVGGPGKGRILYSHKALVRYVSRRTVRLERER